MKDKNLPFVSICTPTFNRRPFIPMIIKCFQNQSYPKNKMEWIIIDDGTDKIEDLLVNIPQIKYFKYDEKMTLGKKRNLLHKKCKGEIIIYFDDDDYYPPERVSHAVDMLLKNPTILCAGSSKMHIYFKHLDEMFVFGPYSENHATAATFAFRKKLLEDTSFQDEASLAEEKLFLKNWTIPIIQLDSLKTILVFSHYHNSFDKRQLLEQNIERNPYIKNCKLKPNNIINEKEILNFFTKEIDNLLLNYDPGKPKHKPDVIKAMEQMTNDRIERQKESQNSNKLILLKKQIDKMTLMIQELTLENQSLKDKNVYLETKLKEIIQKKIIERKKE